MTLNDLECHNTFFMDFLAQTHILRANCDKINRDTPRQPTYETFNIKCSSH